MRLFPWTVQVLPGHPIASFLLMCSSVWPGKIPLQWAGIHLSKDSSPPGVPDKNWLPKRYTQSIFTNYFHLPPTFGKFIWEYSLSRILTFPLAAVPCELPLNFVECWESNTFISFLDAASLGIEVHPYSTWSNIRVSHVYIFLSKGFWVKFQSRDQSLHNSHDFLMNHMFCSLVQYFETHDHKKEKTLH